MHLPSVGAYMYHYTSLHSNKIILITCNMHVHVYVPERHKHGGSHWGSCALPVEYTIGSLCTHVLTPNRAHFNNYRSPFQRIQHQRRLCHY